MSIKLAVKSYFFDEDEKFFGEGPYQLLLGVEKSGSLKSASTAMHMSYSKAHAIVKKMEKGLGYPILKSDIGGKNGGGSELTKEAKEFIRKYELFKKRLDKASLQIYKELF